LTVGSITTSAGGIWLSSLTPTTSNYAFSATSISVQINASAVAQMSAGSSLLNLNTTSLGINVPFTATITAIGTAATAGGTWVNTTAAGAGAQQYSPVSVWEGSGWKTTTTAAAQNVAFGIQCQPVQGSTAPTGNLMLLSGVSATTPTLANIFGINITGAISFYNGVSTAGIGVPAVYGTGNSGTTTNATIASLATYTSTSGGQFDIGAYVNVTTATAAAMTITVTWTDESSTSRTATFSLVQNGVPTPIQTITNVTGVGAYCGLPMTIGVVAGGVITVATAGTVTGIVYTARASIKQAA
jgi:hypothetical protein